MKLNDFTGLDPKLQRLIFAVRSGNIMHALLFTGPEGTGKRSIADIVARAALCPTEGSEPCDECPTCKKCLDGVHPDIHVIDLEEDRKQIRIEQIRELLSKLALASYEGGKKIVIIEHADSMNNSAQNALLKTLEEPVGDTLFILLTSSPGSLLPTIISRCLQVRFSALPTDECARVLVSKGIDRERSVRCAAQAAGCVGRALELAEDQEYFQLKKKVLDAVDSIKGTGDVPQAIASIGKIRNNTMGDQILEILEMRAWDLMRIQNGTDPLEDRSSQMERSRVSGNQMLRFVSEARKNREVNISWLNLIERIFFEIARQNSANA